MTSIVTRVASPALLGLAALAPFGPGRAAAAEPIGTWLTEDGRARVRTEFCGPKGDRLCGYVVWGRKPLDEETGQPRLDKHNPDPARRTRPLHGHQMILGLKPDEEGRYGGKIYNGDNGKSYDVRIWSEAPAELSVKGCLVSILCSTQTWTRVSDVLPGQLQAATDMPGGPRSDPEWSARPAAGAGPGQKVRPAPTPTR